MTTEVGPPETLPVDWRRGEEQEASPILQHSLEAFFEVGYHASSVRDIARRVGVTVPALYYHYASKEAILWALMQASLGRVVSRCKQAVADGVGPEERFFNLVESLVTYMAANRKSAALDAEIRSLGPDNRAAYAKQRRQVETMLVTSIEDGVQAGSFHVTDASATGRAMLGMIQAVSLWYRPRNTLTIPALVERYLDIAAHTAGATDSTLSKLRNR